MSAHDKPISRRDSVKNLRQGKIVLLILFGIFLLVGAIASYFLTVRPYLSIQRAKTWIATPCRVLDSEVRSHRDSEGDVTYSVHIEYEYEVDGRRYQSDRYSFFGGSSSGRAGKARVVRRYPKGGEAICYVDPTDPGRAVIQRGYTLEMLFGLIPLVFFLVGAIGTVFALRWKPGAAYRASADQAAYGVAALEVDESGFTRLKPAGRPLLRVVASVIGAIVFCGVAVGVYAIASGGFERRPHVVASIVLLVVGLIGVGMIGASFYYALALANPRPTLLMRGGALTLGQSTHVGLAFSGQVSAIRRLAVTLEGREEATYQVGTNTHTDKKTFTTIPLFESSDPSEMRETMLPVAVPPETMHSFEAPNNKIVWTLKVHGDIARWPDVREAYKIVVAPPAQG